MPKRNAIACGAVTQRELDQVDAAAQSRGMTRSEFVRSAVLFCAALQQRPNAGRRIRAILAEHRQEETADG